MPSGFSAGLAGGMSKILTAQRETRTKRESENAERSFQTMLAMLQPAFAAGVESGDFSAVEMILGQIDPELPKRFKKQGSPFQQLAPLLQRISQDERSGVLESTPMAGVSTGAGAGTTAPTATMFPPAAAAQTQPTPPAPATTAPAGDETGPTLFGVPFGLSRNERTRQASQDAMHLTSQEIRGRLRQLSAAGMDPTSPEGQHFLLTGDLPTATSTASGFTLSPGQERYDAQGNLIASGPAAPTEALDPGTLALARDVARSPSSLQELTPTDRGLVRRAIAVDPVLRGTYEASVVAPIRAKSERLLGALDTLVTADGTLTPGGRAVFGEYTLPSMRGFSGALSGEATAAQVADASAALRQLIGQEVIDALGEMKAQSATGASGFGPMNQSELDLLYSAATQLTQRLSEETALEQLLIMREGFKKLMLPGEAELNAEYQASLPPEQRATIGPGGARPNAAADAITLDSPLYMLPDGSWSTTPPPAPGAP